MGGPWEMKRRHGAKGSSLEKEKGRLRRPFRLDPGLLPFRAPGMTRLAVLDLRLRAQFRDQLLDLLLLGALAELLLQLGERGHLQGTHVIEADHVIAEIGL